MSEAVENVKDRNMEAHNGTLLSMILESFMDLGLVFFTCGLHKVKKLKFKYSRAGRYPIFGEKVADKNNKVGNAHGDQYIYNT